VDTVYILTITVIFKLLLTYVSCCLSEHSSVSYSVRSRRKSSLNGLVFHSAVTCHSCFNVLFIITAIQHCTDISKHFTDLVEILLFNWN